MGEIILRWIESKLMMGSDSNGRSIVIGRHLENEKLGAGVKPSDLLLMAAASCASWDVIEILQKMKEPFLDFKVICTGEQNTDPPYAFTKIHNHYIVTGAVNAGNLGKAIQLSEEKYCSVISTLRPGVPVTSDFEIVV